MYRGGRNVTRVQESVMGIQNKSVTGTWKNEWVQKYNGGMSSRLWCFGAYECSYKLNDQPVHE